MGTTRLIWELPDVCLGRLVNLFILRTGLLPDKIKLAVCLLCELTLDAPKAEAVGD